MSINNREDANKYYQIINGLVDDYIDNHKIRPSRLSAYLKPGGQRFNKFLERNKLKDIKGIDIILKDVILDREHMENDGVITFENFNYFQSDEFRINSLRECLYKGIDKSTLDQEKILADYFDTNLGSISIIDSDKHYFSVEEWDGERKKVVIFSEEEIEVITENIIQYIMSETSRITIDVAGINLKVEKFLDKHLIKQEIIFQMDKNHITEKISECLGENWSFESVFSSHYLWIGV